MSKEHSCSGLDLQLDRISTQLPLGLKDNNLSGSQLQSFSTLEGYNLSLVRDRLVHKNYLPEQYVDTCIFEFRRYMGLYIVQDGSVGMFNEQVDEVWHQTVLHTRLYFDFCNRIFGRYMHHDPAPGREPNPLESWDRFENLYKSTYRDLPTIWLISKPGVLPKIQEKRARGEPITYQDVA